MKSRIQHHGNTSRPLINPRLSIIKHRILALLTSLILSSLLYAPAHAQFAYRSNSKPDTYSIIDWKVSPRGKPASGIFFTDLKLPAGCLLISSDTCIPGVDVDPTMMARLPTISLRLQHDRGYYLGFLRGISNNPKDIPIFMVSVIDTNKNNPSSAIVVLTAELNYFNDVARTATGDRIYVAPRAVVGSSSTYLSVYEFPCATLPCVPFNLPLNNVGPNQISLQPLSVALSEDEGTLWIGGVDSNTNADGGIIIVDTGTGSTQQNKIKTPKIVGFIPCPNLGAVCR